MLLPNFCRTYRFLGLTIFAMMASGAGYLAFNDASVGPIKSGGFRVATGQIVHSVGDVLTYEGRPIDAALTPDEKWLFLKDEKGLAQIDTGTFKAVKRWSFPSDGGGSLHGLLISHDGKRLWATSSGKSLWEVNIAADGTFSPTREIKLPGLKESTPSYPCGIAISPEEKTLYVCLSMANRIAVIDLELWQVKGTIPTGIAPFDIALTPDGKSAWVSNWGGRLPKSGDRTATSAGTETIIDERGIASTGTVSLLDLTQLTEVTQVAVGLHPSDITLDKEGNQLFIANANDDTVSIVDTRTHKLVQSVVVKPDTSLPFGSMPNTLSISPDGTMLYVGCGGNNAVAVVSLSPSPFVAGWIPAGWYPGAVAAGKQALYIANIKGNGSRTGSEKTVKEGWNVYQSQGTVQRIPYPDKTTLARFTAQVTADSLVPAILRTAERKRNGKTSTPVPERAGEPSTIEHVVYIIKENRTYDQVLGDIKQGNGDANLCVFGQEVTPNHHALATNFVLLDNFYCNGVLSADGHSWATEGNCTDHLEKAFGGFTRSYTFGDDPLTYSSSGFLWDNALAHGLSFRNYGEMDYTDATPDTGFKGILRDWQEHGGKTTFKHKIGVERLARYSNPDCPGWNLNIPDQIRADIFLRELTVFEAKDSFPNLTVIYLPNDHTSGVNPGGTTPRAYLADNDLALGRVVEGISKSRFWSNTCIFVVEDDPQAGFDHVDGHRSLCLVISPYIRRNQVLHNFYNQTSVLHTMEQMLGLPPMNQMDAMSPLMTACFTAKPDMRPFSHISNRIPLTEVNPAKAALSPAMQHWATVSEQQDFRHVDAANEGELNRILWYGAKGATTPYPPSHGKTAVEDD